MLIKHNVRCNLLFSEMDTHHLKREQLVCESREERKELTLENAVDSSKST